MFDFLSFEKLPLNDPDPVTKGNEGGGAPSIWPPSGEEQGNEGGGAPSTPEATVYGRVLFYHFSWLLTSCLTFLVPYRCS